MTITKTRLGTNEDGTPLYHYDCPDGHVVITGPITGTVETKDGTVYNVDEHVIEIPAGAGGTVKRKTESGDTIEVPAHADEVAWLIGERYAAEGHPSHTDGTPFVHTTPAPKVAKR